MRLLARLHFLMLPAALAAVAIFSPPAAAAERPNVVFILSDDLGYGSLGCYGASTDLIQTPNCDRLAREGRRFTDANTTSSVCSPTRYAVVTGRYCWRTPLKSSVLGTTARLHIETDRLTIASMLKEHGYRTAAVGKWHLGYGDQLKVDFTQELTPGPLDIGFDYHFGVPSNHGDITGVFVEDRRVWGLKPGPLGRDLGNTFYGPPFLGLNAPQREDKKVMEVLTDKAVAWLEKQKAGEPFFLYFTPVAVHEPVTPSDTTSGTSKAGPYGDFIHDLDLSVGRILDALDRLGVADNTLVIFTSDNGGALTLPGTPQAQDRSRYQAQAWAAGLKLNGDWRGRKHSIYEGGFRVPYLVRWPGHVPAGTVCDETISLVDTLATVAAIVGHELPPAGEAAEKMAAEDSFSVLPAMLGQQYKGPLRPHLIVHSADGVFAIRQDGWKWIEGKPFTGDVKDKKKKAPPKSRAEEFQEQLYNLTADPSEQSDQLSAAAEKAASLRELLNEQRQRPTTRP
ncbi:MAG: sulfatase family protein [Planctomycetota bacterium]